MQIKDVDDDDDDDDCFHRIFKGACCLHGCARWQHFFVCGQLCCSSTKYVICKE